MDTPASSTAPGYLDQALKLNAYLYNTSGVQERLVSVAATSKAAEGLVGDLHAKKQDEDKLVGELEGLMDEMTDPKILEDARQNDTGPAGGC